MLDMNLVLNLTLAKDLPWFSINHSLRSNCIARNNRYLISPFLFCRSGFGPIYYRQYIKIRMTMRLENIGQMHQPTIIGCYKVQVPCTIISRMKRWKVSTFEQISSQLCLSSGNYGLSQLWFVFTNYSLNQLQLSKLRYKREQCWSRSFNFLLPHGKGKRRMYESYMHIPNIKNNNLLLHLSQPLILWRQTYLSS